NRIDGPSAYCAFRSSSGINKFAVTANGESISGYSLKWCFYFTGIPMIAVTGNRRPEFLSNVENRSRWVERECAGPAARARRKTCPTHQGAIHKIKGTNAVAAQIGSYQIFTGRMEHKRMRMCRRLIFLMKPASHLLSDSSYFP